MKEKREDLGLYTFTTQDGDDITFRLNHQEKDLKDKEDIQSEKRELLEYLYPRLGLTVYKNKDGDKNHFKEMEITELTIEELKQLVERVKTLETKE